MSNTYLSIRVILSAYFILSTCLFFPLSTTAFHGGRKEEDGGSIPVPMHAKHGTVVTKDQRWSVVSTEFGEISGVKVSDGRYGFYHLQFITMEPNSLFIPAHLHSDMVFYVNSGSGTLSWVDVEKDNDKLRQVKLRTGDIYRLPTGSFFYLQSNLGSDRRKFRINAIFSDSKNELREGSSFGAYSSVGDLLLGFDDKVLQAALNVNEEVIQELRSVGRQPMIVHGMSKVAKMFESHYRNMRAFLGFIEIGMIGEMNKNKKEKAFNILEAKHDFENCNGWSLIVTSKQMDVLKDSDFGIFMVNLTKGAMMGPHWNPLTAEIAVVLSGRGMVHVVCPSTIDEAECKNLRFRVEEGDVFVVPRYHPMAQLSFNNGSFVFVGFTTTQRNNHPQYLVGSASVFQVLDSRVLAASLGVSNTTMDEIMAAQNEAIILECTSCAEEEERLMEEEIQRQKEEEERKKEEEEEEAREKEEEERKREEEEEERKKEEEARKREEEEEEARREQEEAEAKRRKEEEAARQQEEEAAAKRRQEEEEAARQQEEAAKRQQEEEAARQQEEEAAKRWQEEEAEAAGQQEDDRRRRQEEEAARQQEAADRQRQQQDKAETRRRQQEEAAAKKQEADMRKREDEEAASRKKQQEEEEEAARQQQEQDASRQQEEAMRRREEEKMAPRGGRGRDKGGMRHQGQGEGEAARKQEEEMARRDEEAEAGGQGYEGIAKIRYPQRM